MKADLVRFRTFAQAVRRERQTKELENIGKGTAVAIAGVAEAAVLTNLDNLSQLLTFFLACGSAGLAVVAIICLVEWGNNRLSRLARDHAELLHPFVNKNPVPQEFIAEDAEAANVLQEMATSPSRELKIACATIDSVNAFAELADRLERMAESLNGSAAVFEQAEQTKARLVPLNKEFVALGEQVAARTLAGAASIKNASAVLATASSRSAGTVRQVAGLVAAVETLETELLGMQDRSLEMVVAADAGLKRARGQREEVS